MTGRTRLAVLAAGLASLLAGACTSRPSLVRERFAFPPADPGAADPATGPALSVPPAEVAAAFDRVSFVYRTGETSYETDPYAQLLASPRDLVADALRDRLRATGRFRLVTARRAPEAAGLVLAVEVRSMHGDFRDRSAPAAVLSLRATAFRAGEEAPALSKGYEKRVPIPARRPEALVAGWDAALSGIAGEVVADLAAAGLLD